jgi:hypothetical protein
MTAEPDGTSGRVKNSAPVREVKHRPQRFLRPANGIACPGFRPTVLAALASSSRSIVAYRTGKRNVFTTQEFVADLRERVLGSPRSHSSNVCDHTLTERLGIQGFHCALSL